MSFNQQIEGLHVEDVSLARIAAEYGTPCYVYSRASLTAAWRAWADALAGRDALVCYAMKANSSLAILEVFARLGSGFDIVSAGELERVIAAGGDPQRVVFSGVGKSRHDIERALAVGILCFNVESWPELLRIESVAAARGARARISVRVNPDVDAGTHPYISTGLRENKFGVPFTEALTLYRHAHASAHLEVVGVDVHIGSQITELAPFLEALERTIAFADGLAAEGIAIHHLDLGGGVGIRYRDEEPIVPSDYIDAVWQRLGARPWQVLFEPGRSLVGNAGVLLTRVEYLKAGAERHFAIVDAAMNDLLRPSLYEAWHDIRPVAPRSGAVVDYDVVGPVCESGDFLGRARPLSLVEGDLLAVMSAGAYGMSMSSNYNSRPRAAEVLVDGTAVHVIRERETIEDLYRGEHLIGR
jgi:diaminopimelate decarboxylase